MVLLVSLPKSKAPSNLWFVFEGNTITRPADLSTQTKGVFNDKYTLCSDCDQRHMNGSEKLGNAILGIDPMHRTWHVLPFCELVQGYNQIDAPASNHIALQDLVNVKVMSWPERSFLVVVIVTRGGIDTERGRIVWQYRNTQVRCDL